MMLADRDRAYWQGTTDDDDPSNLLIIGIDFGTTFSGVAWATPYDVEQDQINLIQSWPGMGPEKGKVPTELCYDEDEVLWGYEIPSDADPVQWFKLLLLRDEDLDDSLRSSEYVQRCRRMLEETGKQPIDLVADYLGLLWDHVLDTISRDRGEAAVDGMKIHIVLTVPAIWQGYARQRMERAVQQAGMLDERDAGPTDMSFVTEPEAAALSTLYNNLKACKKDDVYIICDAGGGTVDLISYNVTCSSPVVIGEAVEGTGGLFGSIFIDEAFERMAQQRLGPKWDNLSKAGVKELVQGEWQQAIKPQYTQQPNSKRMYTVRIPAEVFHSKAELTDLSKEPHIKAGRFHLSAPLVEKMFEESLRGIDMLIDEQIREVKAKKGLDVTSIILVGGLGASPYLYQHLKKQHGPRNISVLQSTGTKPWTAICRGAVYKGYYQKIEAVSAGVESLADWTGAGHGGETAAAQTEAGGGGGGPGSGLGAAAVARPMNPMRPLTIESTVSRFSVGLCFSQLFDSAHHDEADRYWDDKEEVYFAGRQMEWYLRKGSSVSTLEPIRHDFYLLFDGTKTDWTRELYLCGEPDPPQRKDDSVIKMCDIRCDFSSIADSLPFFETAKGRRFRKFSYEIMMKPSGATVEFAVLYRGKQLASQEVKVCFD